MMRNRDGSRVVRARWLALIAAVALAMLGSSLIPVGAAASPPSTAAAPGPRWSCTASGYQFQDLQGNAPTNVSRVDLASGATTKVLTLGNVAVSAVGYNTRDNYLYGWDNAAGQLVRIASNGAVTSLGVPTGMPRASVPGGIRAGTFDGSGHLWLASGGGTSSAAATIPISLVEVDLAPDSPTYNSVISSGTATLPAGMKELSDWAYVKGALYAVGSPASTTSPVLVKFDPTTDTMTSVGSLAGVPGTSAYGAAYASPGGYLWVTSDQSGAIYRIDTVTLQTTPVSNAGPSPAVDGGTRCASAPIPTIMVTTTVGGRVPAPEQFSVGLKGPQRRTLTSVHTAGTATSASTTNWPVTQGDTYTITDRPGTVAAHPTLTNLRRYKSTILCKDTSTGATAGVGGSTRAWTLRVTAPDAYACTVTNTPIATPTTTKPARTPTTAAPTASAAPAADPSTLRLVETATCGTPPRPCTSVSAAGDTITYRYFLTNASDVSIANITVTDHRPGPTTTTIDCHASPNPNPLPPGGRATCSSTYTVTANDVAAGSILDTARASGTDTANGSTVSSNPYSVSVDVRPELPGFTAALVNPENTLKLVGSPAADTACSGSTTGGNLCVLAGSGNVLDLGSGIRLTVGNDIWWNSNASPAASNGTSAEGSVSARAIGGRGSANNPASNRWQPLPVTDLNFPIKTDPFANTPEPPPAPPNQNLTQAQACDLDGTTFSNTGGTPPNPNPGVYNSISITGGSVTLNPGVYTIKQFVNISSTSTLNGSGVTLYFCTAAGTSGNAGIPFRAEGSSSVTLTAPGGTSGFALFFARTNACTNGDGGLIFTGSGTRQITGRIYNVSTATGCAGRLRATGGTTSVTGDVVVQRVFMSGATLNILRAG